ncbi:translation initiation factor IF-2-like [Parus major]|uniref:translation initiation factor IF-2-like n=1 Tax=Parus major TaxID=9157 RepID=UPI0007715E7D|nr:translation initiation factor IF-2-like [Parus major]
MNVAQPGGPAPRDGRQPRPSAAGAAAAYPSACGGDAALAVVPGARKASSPRLGYGTCGAPRHSPGGKERAKYPRSMTRGATPRPAGAICPNICPGAGRHVPPRGQWEPGGASPRRGSRAPPAPLSGGQNLRAPGFPRHRPFPMDSTESPHARDVCREFGRMAGSNNEGERGEIWTPKAIIFP